MRPLAALSIPLALSVSACQEPEPTPAPTPEVPTWARAFGDADNQSDIHLAVGPQGNIALTGTFSGALDFGGGALSSARPAYWGEGDLFLASFTPEGVHRWSGSTGSRKVQAGTGAAVDALGNVTVVGAFQNQMSLGQSLMTAESQDGFVARFDPSGNVDWAAQAAADDIYSAVTLSGGVALDADRAMILAGKLEGATSFGGATLEGEGVTYLAKLDHAGKHLFSLATGGYEHEPHALAIDPSGGVFVVGENWGTMTLGATTITATWSQGYVASVSADGAPRWLMPLSSSDWARAHAVVATPDGGALVGGCYSGQASFTLAPGDGTWNGFVAKLDRDGGIERVTDIPSTCVAALAIDGDAHVYAGGQYIDAPSFAEGAFPNTYAGSAILVELDPSGAIVRAGALAQGNDSAVTGLASIDGDLVIAGWFASSITIGDETLETEGNSDLFVARVHAR